MQKAGRQNKRASGGYGIVVTAVLFVAVLAIAVAGTLDVSRGAEEEGLATAQKAIERAAVVCYATEGFYPPSLSYIEENYQVAIDKSKYAVRYEVLSASIPPRIQVVPIAAGS